MDRTSLKDLGDTAVLYPKNYINDIEGEKLEEVCGSLLQRGTRKMVIDFSGTELINSIGVSILIGIIEKVRASGGTVFFSGLKRINYDIMRIVGITKHVRVCASEEEALEEMKGISGESIL